MKETFASISTPPGIGGIGIVRISGTEAVPILRKVFRPVGKIEDFDPKKMYLGKFLYDEGGVLDKCMAVVFRAPRSYTGEDLVEIQMHGGSMILHTALKEILKYCRPAEPGEFTKTAFLNGKLDLIEAESVAELIHATTTLSGKRALQGLSGDISEKIGYWEGRVMRLLAEVEVNLDYYDDADLPEFDTNFHISEIEFLLSESERLLSSYKTGKILRDGARVILAGFPNAGKSSLFNSLVGKNRAIVSQIAGTTRDTLEELVDIGGVPMILVDTAGIRDDSTDEIENLGIARSREELLRADLILWLTPFSDREKSLEIAEDIFRENSSMMVCVTKSDIENIGIDIRSDFEKEIEQRFPSADISFISAEDHASVSELSRKMKEYFLGDMSEHEGLTLTTERQRRKLNDAVTSLLHARENIRDLSRIDMLGEDYRGALKSFSSLIGKEIGPDVLDRVFSTFCVGK